MKMKNRVLAVLLLALLMINMVPVREAEASVEYDIDLRNYDYVSVGYDDVFIDNLLNDYRYVVVYQTTSEWWYVRFLKSPDFTTDIYKGSDYTRYSIYHNEDYYEAAFQNNDLKGIPFYGTGGYTKNDLIIYCSNEKSNVKGSNFDLLKGFESNEYYTAALNELPMFNIQHPFDVPVYDYFYSSSGPVAATWSVGISNLMRFVGTELEDLDDLYTKSNWEAKYDNWVHRIIYRLQGELPSYASSDPTDGSMYKLYTESVLAFPSKEIVTGWISSGMTPVELYPDNEQSKWFQTVYNGQNTSVKVKVTCESVPSYHSLMNGYHVFQVDIPMTDIIASVDESFDGGLRGYYGLSQEMWNLWKNSVYSFVLPYEIYTVLYAKEDGDTMVYGNMHYSVPNWTDIDPLSKGYVFTGGVIEKPLEDITDDDKQEIQIDTTKEELAKRTEELEQLKKEYEEALKLNGNDEDVFGLFSKFTNGLRSSTGSFKGIALAVGNVFAFFPEDITSLLYGGIIIMIVIAIYKALRG